jgi:hypothetical protein
MVKVNILTKKKTREVKCNGQNRYNHVNTKVKDKQMIIEINEIYSKKCE